MVRSHTKTVKVSSLIATMNYEAGRLSRFWEWSDTGLYFLLTTRSRRTSLDR